MEDTPAAGRPPKSTMAIATGQRIHSTGADSHGKAQMARGHPRPKASTPIQWQPQPNPKAARGSPRQPDHPELARARPSQPEPARGCRASQIQAETASVSQSLPEPEPAKAEGQLGAAAGQPWAATGQPQLQPRSAHRHAMDIHSGTFAGRLNIIIFFRNQAKTLQVGCVPEGHIIENSRPFRKEA